MHTSSAIANICLLAMPAAGHPADASGSASVAEAERSRIASSALPSPSKSEALLAALGIEAKQKSGAGSIIRARRWPRAACRTPIIPRNRQEPLVEKLGRDASFME